MAAAQGVVLAAEAANYPWYIAAVLILLGGGLGTALVSMRRAPAQNQIDGVQALRETMAELRVELKRITEKADRLETALDAAEEREEKIVRDRDRWRDRAVGLGWRSS